jgi:hypothetical protein
MTMEFETEEEYFKAISIMNDEILLEIRKNFVRYVEWIDKELKRRKK